MPRKRKGRGRGNPVEGQEPPPVGMAQGGAALATAAAAAPPPLAQAAAMSKPVSISPEEVGLHLERKLTIPSNLPRRPDYGKQGRKIQLIANCFKLEAPGGNIYHYDVEIADKRNVITATPDATPKEKKYRCLSTKRNREVVKLMLATDNFRGVYAAYDGQKNLYTRKPLSIAKSLKVEVFMDDEDMNPNFSESRKAYEIVIKPVNKKETNSCAISLDPLREFFRGKTQSEIPQEAIMALETVLRHSPCMTYVPVGRSFFYTPRPEDVHPLGGGREIWFGYHQSLRLGQWQPLVNIDVTATTFYSRGPVLQFISKILNKRLDSIRFLTDNEIKKLSKELKNLRIEVTHLHYRRKYRVLRLTKQAANILEFPLTINGKQVMKKVSDYFHEQHKTKLRYAHLPCLQVGTEAKKTYLPIEVCEIVGGQHFRKKLESEQTAEMIKFTAVQPNDRFRKIQGIVRESDFNNDNTVRDFGMKVVCEPLRLEGRVIEPPNIRYHKGERIMPRDGTWNMQNKQFYKGAGIKKWVLLSFSHSDYCSSESLERFTSLLIRIGNENGISINKPAMTRQLNLQRDKVNIVLGQVHQQLGIDLAVVVIPEKNNTLHGEIKQAAETMLGLKTQCIKDVSVVKKCNPALLSNICQKINAKMGGINNSLTPGETPEIFKKPIMIIGADVNHPGPSPEVKPSLAAAVGSLDPHPSRYAVTCRAQPNIDKNKKSVEVIRDLKGMVMELLMAFHSATKGKKPEKIIFYRDGVSEGQFDIVKQQEVKSIRDACRQTAADYEPEITFVVVQKRHHTRFMPQNSREGVGRARNIPPGTAVDTEVSHPLNFDFFLCSHLGLQGTSRPAHYTVIEDDNKFTSDELQKLTFYLCHTYVRCTKSISIPAPVAYAHLAAFRARQYLVAQGCDATADSDITSDSGEKEYRELSDNVKKAIQVKGVMEDTMYFV